MRKTTSKVVEMFPALEKHIPDYDSVLLEQQTLNQFNDVEQVFLKLIWFFENPNEYNFNLFDLYRSLDDDWLSFALECIVSFFENDTYLLKETQFSLVKESNDYLNQTRFADFLNEHKSLHGKNFSRAMLNSYLNRGIIPEPDLELAGTKYWLKETCEEYLSSLSDSFHEQEISNNKFDATDVFFKQRSLNLLDELLIEYKNNNNLDRFDDSVIITAKILIDNERTKIEK